MSVMFPEISEPYIDGLTVERIASKAVKENIFQGIMLKPNEAVTEKYSEDTDAAEIQVLRIKPTANDAREIGAETNGSWFNSEDAATSQTEAYGIRILQTIDRCVDIPTNSQDMVRVDLLEGELRNLGGLINRNVNAITVASGLQKNFNNVAGYDRRTYDSAINTITAIEKNWITHGSSYTDDIIDACAMLDDGNADQGIDAYPDDRRCILIRPTIKAEILKNMTGLYGGTAVYQLLRNGGLNPDKKPEVATTGFVGEINNTPVYCMSAIGWKLVESYLGLSAGALDTLAAVVFAADATGRALAFNNKMKKVDTMNGQGIRLQPKYRMGCETWDGLGIVPIFSSAFTNPVTGSASTLYVRGVGSRS